MKAVLLYVIITVLFCGTLSDRTDAQNDATREEDLAGLHSSIAYLTGEIYKLRAENEKLKEDMTQMNSNFEDYRLKRGSLLENNVGFTAHMTGGLRYVANGNTIVYDLVQSNVGNGYNGESGYFTCPVSGYYFFHFSIYTERMHTNDQSHFSLFIGHQGGTEVMSIFTRKQGTEDVYNTVSNAAFVSCEANEPVWVKASAEGQVCGDGTGTTSTVFSGFLVGLP